MEKKQNKNKQKKAINKLDIYHEIKTLIANSCIQYFTCFTLRKIWSFPSKISSCKCDQIRSKLWIWSHLLKKSLMKNFSFCAVSILKLTKIAGAYSGKPILDSWEPQSGSFLLTYRYCSPFSLKHFPCPKKILIMRLFLLNNTFLKPISHVLLDIHIPRGEVILIPASIFCLVSGRIFELCLGIVRRKNFEFFVLTRYL